MCYTSAREKIMQKSDTTGFTTLRLGSELRDELEAVCKRRQVSLTDFVRDSVRKEIANEEYWRFRMLRYLTQVVLVSLSTPFVKEKIGFSGDESVQLRRHLRWFYQLINKRANSEWHWEYEIPEVESFLGAISSEMEGASVSSR